MLKDRAIYCTAYSLAYICSINEQQHAMNTPSTITIRNAKFSFVKSFTTANVPEGCTAQAEYVGQRGRSVFVQFFNNGTARAIDGGKAQPVIL